jgi:hypothetical protein
MKMEAADSSAALVCIYRTANHLLQTANIRVHKALPLSGKTESYSCHYFCFMFWRNRVLTSFGNRESQCSSPASYLRGTSFEAVPRHRSCLQVCSVRAKYFPHCTFKHNTTASHHIPSKSSSLCRFQPLLNKNAVKESSLDLQNRLSWVKYFCSPYQPKISSSWMLRHIVRSIVTDVSEEHGAFIFRVEGTATACNLALLLLYLLVGYWGI